MIMLPTGTRIWIIAGITDMRCGFNGLASKVQNTLKDDPFSGHIFVFRRRRDIIENKLRDALFGRRQLNKAIGNAGNDID